MIKSLLIISLLLLFTNSKAQNYSDTLPLKDSFHTTELSDVSPIMVIEDESENDQPVSSLLTAGRDIFLNAIAFNFSFSRLRYRGYNNAVHTTIINGIAMNDLRSGNTLFSIWGGLNDVMRQREIGISIVPNGFYFGTIGTSTSIDMRSSKQRKGMIIGHAVSNRNYRNRVSLTYHSGISKKGWAFSAAAVTRMAKTTYIPGTFYYSYSYYAGIDRSFSTDHLVSLVVLGSLTENGRTTPVTKELHSLTGDRFYDPLWGLQNGKTRNSGINRSHQPLMVLSHEWRSSENAKWKTSIAFTKGERAASSLDWFDAADPRPDNYRYLPSYVTIEAQKQALADQLKADLDQLQVNWHHMYDVNRNSIETISNTSGSGIPVSGLRSKYILQDRINTLEKISFNSVYNALITKGGNISAGISYQQQKDHSFKKIKDLLGGEFYVDLDQFAEQVTIADTLARYNDIRFPNRILHVNDIFGYSYQICNKDLNSWVELVLTAKKVDVFVAAQFGIRSIQRNGFMQNGSFPDHSLGRSKEHFFPNNASKAGLTYKLNGRNYLFINAAFYLRPPASDDLFIAPQKRDLVQSEISSFSIYTSEIGYILQHPKHQIKATAYFTRSYNEMNVLSFYHDDHKTMVNYAFRNGGQQHMGIELAGRTRPIRNIDISSALMISRSVFKGRQKALVTQDNDASVLDEELIYINNYRVGNTPQRAANFTFSYRSPDYWFCSAAFNYVDDIWVEVNPIRRTTNAVDGAESDEKKHTIIDQQRLPYQYTVDLFAGYSFRIPRSFGWGQNKYLMINVGVNNLLNNINIINNAFEQLRFDFQNKDVNKFPVKVTYAQGVNYFLSVSLRM